MSTGTNVKNVTAGKPKIGGAVWTAPMANTTIPTDAITDLDSAFKSLGYCGEDGLTNSNSPDTDSTKAWGGDEVLAYNKGKTDTFKLVLIEALNKVVLQSVYGDENVTGDLDTGMHVKATNADMQEKIWVVETLLRGNVAKRVVIPDGQITEIGDIVYKDDDVVGYEVTIKAFPDSEGVTHHEYLQKVTEDPESE